jgi:hypothetical protein
MTAATLPLTFTNSWAHPDHMPELALFTLGALAVARGSDWRSAIALAVAAESGDVCIPRGAVRRGRTVGARPVLRGGLFGLEWLAIYAGLRVWRGLQHYDYWQAGRNLTDLTFPLPSEHYDPYYRASRTSSS